MRYLDYEHYKSAKWLGMIKGDIYTPIGGEPCKITNIEYLREIEKAEEEFKAKVDAIGIKCGQEVYSFTSNYVSPSLRQDADKPKVISGESWNLETHNTDKKGYSYPWDDDEENLYNDIVEE